jgi:hypothetical protein
MYAMHRAVWPANGDPAVDSPTRAIAVCRRRCSLRDLRLAQLFGNGMCAMLAYSPPARPMRLAPEHVISPRGGTG